MWGLIQHGPQAERTRVGELVLELELMQTHMAQKLMLGVEVGARARAAGPSRVPTSEGLSKFSDQGMPGSCQSSGFFMSITMFSHGPEAPPVLDTSRLFCILILMGSRLRVQLEIFD